MKRVGDVELCGKIVTVSPKSVGKTSDLFESYYATADHRAVLIGTLIFIVLTVYTVKWDLGVCRIFLNRLKCN